MGQIIEMSKKFTKPQTFILSAGNALYIRNNFKSVGFFPIVPFPVIHMESGWGTCFALTQQGLLYGKGVNEKGELGLGDNNERNEWVLVSPKVNHIFIAQMSYKTKHILILTQNGQVYSCGENCHGQLGIGNKTKFKSRFSQILQPYHAKKVETGMSGFCFVLCSNQTNLLFSFGLNSHGQLGINKTRLCEPSPILVSFFLDKSPIKDIKCGQAHTIILCANGSLYAMGMKECCGQASSNEDFYSPVLVSNNVQSILCSISSTIFQTIDHQWFGFGDKEKQSFPAYGKEVSLTPERMDDVFPQGIQVKKLVATAYGFFLLTSKNELYVVGDGGYGELGIRDIDHLKKWTFKTHCVDIQTGICSSFLFFPCPFLVYEPQMKYADTTIYH